MRDSPHLIQLSQKFIKKHRLLVCADIKFSELTKKTNECRIDTRWFREVPGGFEPSSPVLQTDP